MIINLKAKHSVCSQITEGETYDAIGIYICPTTNLEYYQVVGIAKNPMLFNKTHFDVIGEH